MFCALIGVRAESSDELPTIATLVKNKIVRIQGVAVEWREYSSVRDADGGYHLNLLLQTISQDPATPDAIVMAVGDATDRECELWASCPAPLPLKPSHGGYDLQFQEENSHDDTKLAPAWPNHRQAKEIMQEWGILFQTRILEPKLVLMMRQLVNEAIDTTHALISAHRPEINLGRDTFCFSEIASRGNERFDLRLNSHKAHEFINCHILGQRRIKEFVESNLDLSISDIDFDLSVVYSRPGASHQGWHADGDHQKGVTDAGWSESGWRTQLAGAYAICLFIPLIDLNDSVGYTQFWPGSHRNRDLLGFGKVAELTEAVVDAKTIAGNGVWYDYRLFHRGMPNKSSDTLRPVIQIIFKKKWYIERANYGKESILKARTTI